MSDPTQTSDSSPDPQSPSHADTLPPRVPDPVTATGDHNAPRADPLSGSIPVLVGTPAPPPGFEIIRELGSGGMGVVYEAKQSRLNRTVALKVLRSERNDANSVMRFLVEAEAVAAVKHPHIVQVYEFGQDAGCPYLALELLTGGTLSDKLRVAKLEPRAAAALVAKLADAVRATHDLGIVHRDLKPANVLFDSDGTPKITDFGLAKRTGGADLTRTQAVMGTPAYMAPEQARGDAKFVGPQADVWALGVILYECLTGKRPFEADETWAILRKVTDEHPSSLQSLVPGIPRDLELIALKCLEKHPAERYATAAALADDLQRFLDGKPVSVRAAGHAERFVKWCKRNPVIAGFSAALLFVAVLGFAGITWALLETEKREKELAKANSELSKTNNALTQSEDALTKSVNELTYSRSKLIEQANALTKSRNALAESSENAEARSYLSDVALAHQFWKANDFTSMRGTLARCPVERRKWEWHYLDRLSRPERAAYPADSMPVALAYSPNGKFLASFTLVGTISVREVDTGLERFVQAVDNPDDKTRSLMFRPDNKELAFSTGNRLWVLDLQTWNSQQVAPEKSNHSGIVAVGYSPASVLLVAMESKGGFVGDKDDAPKKVEFSIREAVSNKQIVTMPAWNQPSSILVRVAGAFSPDGTRFTINAVDSGIRIGVAGQKSPKFDPFHPLLLVWEIPSGKEIGRAEGGGGVDASVSFSQDSKSIAFGCRGMTVDYKPRPDAPNMTPRMMGQTGEVLTAAFGRDLLIWSGGEDRLIRAYHRGTGAEQFVIRGCPNRIIRLAVSPDGKEVAAAVGDYLGRSAIYRFDVSALGLDVWRSQSASRRIGVVSALAPHGERFAACELNLDDPGEGSHSSIHATFAGKEGTVNSAGLWLQGVFRPDGGVVVVEEQALRLIGADGKPGDKIMFPREFTRGLSPLPICSPDGRLVGAIGLPERAGQRMSGELRMRVMTWNPETRMPGKSLDVDLSATVAPKLSNNAGVALFPTSAAFDPEGKRLAVSCIAGWRNERGRFELRGAVVVWEVATGTELFREVREEEIHAVTFDPQGHVVVAGGTASTGAVFGWDITTKKKVLTIFGHSRPIYSLAFGPDDRLATGGSDHVVKLWDLKTNREVLTLDGFSRDVTHLAFTKFGHELVAGTGMNMINELRGNGVRLEMPPAEVRIFRGTK